MSSSAILLKPHVLRISFTELKQPTFCRCQLMDINYIIINNHINMSL